MASDGISARLDARSLAESLSERVGDQRYPPVHDWNPDNCGEIDMRIARDGTWYYMGSPIRRDAMVRLFSSVMRRDEDGQVYLVTPVEKLAITVDDAPYLAAAVQPKGTGEDQILTFVTQTGELVTADADHPIWVEEDENTGEPSPYILVRDRLEALISRPVYYELAELAKRMDLEGRSVLGVWSRGCFFPMGQVEHKTDA